MYFSPGSGSSHTSHEESDLPPPPPSTVRHRLVSQPAIGSNLPASYNDISGEIRINGTKWRPMNNVNSDDPVHSPTSSQDQDEWSKQIDELDQLGPLHPSADRFSPSFGQADFGGGGGGHRLAGGGGTTNLRSPPPQCISPTQLSEKSGVVVVNGNLSDFEDDVDNNHDCASSSASSSTRKKTSSNNTPSRDAASSRLSKGAELHLREVEEEMQQIFTPTPVELLRVTLTRWHRGEDFGFSLSDGVYEKGVYISAVRPGGPADRVELRPFDRILQVTKTV